MAIERYAHGRRGLVSAAAAMLDTSSVARMLLFGDRSGRTAAVGLPCDLL